MADDMIILTRTFDLLAWLLPKTEKFPKVYRHTVTQRMMNAALDFQEALFDAHLNKLRLYLRLAHHWGWINDGQYRHVSAMVAEIGRLLGGWMKNPGQ